MDEEKMIKFEGSALYQFENLPCLFNDREYDVSGVAEVSYHGEASQIISRNFMGVLECEIIGFVEIYVEDEHGNPPDIILPNMLDSFSDALVEAHADKLIDACSEDALKWMKDDSA
jgi:hypothetical protein